MTSTRLHFSAQHPPRPQDVSALIAQIDAYLRGDDETEEWDVEPLLQRAATMLALLRVPSPAR